MTERSPTRLVRAPASRLAGNTIVPAVLLSWLIIAAPFALGQAAEQENLIPSDQQGREVSEPAPKKPLEGDVPLEGDMPREEGRLPAGVSESILSLREFRPRSQLQVASHPRDHAAFPVVDIHTHLFYKLRNNRQALDDLVATMNRNRIAVCVSLDGQLGSRLDEHLDYLWSDHRNRFVVFANIDWKGDGEAYPSREELLAARNRVIERHPKTQFIGAHVANNPENLAVVSQWLDRYPNLWIEISSRIAELEVLKKLYHENAARLIPGVAVRVEAFQQRIASGEPTP